MVLDDKRKYWREVKLDDVLCVVVGTITLGDDMKLVKEKELTITNERRLKRCN